MKRNPDGTVDLEKGEYIPFVCPVCQYPIEYDTSEFLLMVRCPQCGYIGTRDLFSASHVIKKPR